jgi:plasmid stabilization system protein ParE
MPHTVVFTPEAAWLRITSYRKRVVIAFDVDADRVNIIGIFYDGQDYETALQEEDEEA